MTRARTRWLAWSMGLLSVGLSVAAVGLAAGNGEGPAELVDNHHAIGIVTAIGIAVLGAIIASRKPRNPIGWLMSVAALLLGVVNVTQRYAPLAVAEALPLVGFSSWLVAAATRSAELLGVVDQTVQPARTSLWLRRAEDARS